MNNISKLCFGCEPLGGVDSGNVDLNMIKKSIYKALDLGINFFDTAGVYGLGLSETRLSKILGNLRHDLVIATKGGMTWKNSESSRNIVVKDSSPYAIRRDVESSLKRLNMEFIPIFFVHWPDENTPIEDTFLELMKLKKEGKIKSIGCSNFSNEQLVKACCAAKIDYIQTAINILDSPLNETMNSICTEYNIKIIAYNVLKNGLLTGKFNKNSTFPVNDRRSRLPIFKGKKFKDALTKVEEIRLKALNFNSNILSFSINSVISLNNVISLVIGIKNTKQIEQNWNLIKNYHE